MLSEPQFFLILVVLVLPVAFFIFNREHQKGLDRIESDLRESVSAQINRLERTVSAQNQNLAEHTELRLESAADQISQSLEVLRAAIDHQVRQQERILERLESLESTVPAGVAEGRTAAVTG